MQTLTNSSNQVIHFTHQDVDLLCAYNKIKKFRIRDKKDLRGIIVNVRSTHAMCNMWVSTHQVVGVAHKDVSTRHRFWKIGTKKKTKYGNKSEHVDTLIGYNAGFKFNSKVVQFVELLKKADRFQQHCIIRELEYNQKSWDDYCRLVHQDIELDKFFKNMPFYAD